MRLILLPGLHGTGHLFEPLLGALPPGVQATVVKYPPSEQRSYDELFDQVAALLPSDEPYVIVAESFSGPIAVRLAAAAPQNLRAVVLCASFVYLPGSAVTRVVMRMLSRIMFVLPAPRWVVRYFLAGGDATEGLLSLFYAALSTVSASVLGHRLRMVLAADERETLRRTSVPMLYLLATRDHLLSRECAELMIEFRRDLTIVPIESPHLVLQREPAQALAKIESWMGEQGLHLRGDR